MLRTTATPPTLARPRRLRRRTGAAAGVAALLLAGCGGEDGATTVEQPGAGPDTPVTSPSTGTGTGTATPGDTATPDVTGPTVPAELSVQVDDGSGGSTTWTLRCSPPGGDHPRPDAACAALAASPEALAPVPGAVACTEIYGGPQTARLSGTLDGSPVTATFERTNGCEIDRWETLVPLLPAVEGVSVP